MPRMNSTAKLNKIVSRRRPVSETSNSGSSDTSSMNVLHNLSERDSISDKKSPCVSPFYSEYSSDEYEDHDYCNVRKKIPVKLSLKRHVLEKLEDTSNFNQGTNIAGKNRGEKSSNLGLNKNSCSSFKNTNRSKKTLVKMTSNRNLKNSESSSMTSNDYSDLASTYKQSKNKNISKNAINAKINRIKKKQHVQELENEIISLKKENASLQSCIECNSELISSLKNEVKYLRSIIANSNELGTILRNVCQNTNLEISPLKRTSLIRSMNSKEIKHNDRIQAMDDLETDNFISGINSIDSPPYTPDVPYIQPQQFINSFEDVLLNVSHNTEPQTNDSVSDLFQLNLLETVDFVKTEALSTEENDEFMLWNKSPLEMDISNSNFNDDVGVCLHVSNKKVSLEFCASCNLNSTSDYLKNTDCT